MSTRRRPVRRPTHALLPLLLLPLCLPTALAAQISDQDRERGHKMLETLQEDLEEFYFDSTYGGRSLDSLARATRTAIGQAPSEAHMILALGQFLAALGDSHTWLIPPGYSVEVDYGYDLMFIGDTLYVVDVTAASSAADLLKKGDVVLAVDGRRYPRDVFWVYEFLYHTLTPRAAVTLTVRSPGEEIRTVKVESKVTRGSSRIDLNDPHTRVRLEEKYWMANRDRTHLYGPVGEDVLLWRMPVFGEGDRDIVDRVMKQARKHRALVLDMRGNPGGSVKTQLHLLSHFFGEEVAVAAMLERQKTDTLRTRRRKDPFQGSAVVLLDSRSASSAEIVARTLQLHGRGTVIGDRSAGAVRVSRHRLHKVGFGRQWYYGAAVTVADVVMPDGQGLEGVGVEPDEWLVPASDDLAHERDPVLARALALAGVAVTPEEAAALMRRSER